MSNSDTLGSERIQKLLFNLGWPAALNFLVVVIYNLTDIIFVGRYLGPVQIAAVVIVGLITFLLSSFGMAIGIGGGSIIARALGERNRDKTAAAFVNQNILFLATTAPIVVFGWLFQDGILRCFGTQGEIFHYARSYYRVLLFGVPFLSWSLMCNSVVQAQGRARTAMLNSLLPTIVNTTLNPIFINTLNMGVEGSAWATLTGYVLNCVLVTMFLHSGRNEVRVRRSDIRINWPILREITAIGGTVVLEVFAGNLFTIVLNRIIFQYEREAGVVIAGIVQRMTLLFLIPFIAIDSGLRPIIGYNFGSGQQERIRQAIMVAIRNGAIICYLLFGLMVILSQSISGLFTTDEGIMEKVSLALRVIFLFFPLGIIPIVTSIYFQAIARPRLAFCLILLRSLLLLIPLLYLFSYAFGYNGILWTFPVVDVLTALTASWLLRKEMNLKLFK